MSQDFRIIRMTGEHIDGAVAVLRQSFFPSEKVCCCVRLLEDSEDIANDTGYKVTAASKELEDLAVDTVKDGVSFVAVDSNTNQVLGVAFNKIQTKPPPGELSYFEKFAKDNVKQRSALEVVNFMVVVDGKYDIFGCYDTDCYFEIMFLAVRTDTKGRGIGTALVSNSVDLAQRMKDRNGGRDTSIDVKSGSKENEGSAALDMVPKCVTAIFTSKFSQICGRRSGFEEVLKVPYYEFAYNGKLYSETTGPDHPYCTLSIKKLE